MREACRFWRSGLAVLVRPWLWRSAWTFKPNGYLRFLPPSEYVAFRMMTMYGDPEATPSAKETIRFLNWCRSGHKATGRSDVIWGGNIAPPTETGDGDGE